MKMLDPNSIFEYLDAVNGGDSDFQDRLSKFKTFLSGDNGFPDGLPRDVFMDLEATTLFKISKLYLPQNDSNFKLADLRTSKSERDRLFSLLKSESLRICCDDDPEEPSERPQTRQRSSSTLDNSSQANLDQILVQLSGLATAVSGLATKSQLDELASKVSDQSRNFEQFKQNVSEKVQFGSVRKASEYFKDLLSNLKFSDHAPHNEFANQISQDRLQEIWSALCQRLQNIKRKKVHIYSNCNTAAKVITFGSLLKCRNPRFKSENLCQAFLNEVFRILCDLLPDRTVDWRDTSRSNAPTNPLHLFDASFVCKGAGSSHENFPVAWSDMVWIAQYKKNINLEVEFHDSEFQILDGIAELCLKQRYFDANRHEVGRKAGFGVVTDGASICFLKYAPQSKGHDLEVVRSKKMLLFPNSDISSEQPISDGFKFLVHLLLSNYETLHFVAPRHSTLPNTHLVSDHANVRAHRLNDLGKPDIFFVTPNQESQTPFAIKRYFSKQQFDDELMCYQFQKLTAEQALHFPQLVDHDKTNLLIGMRPLAQSTLLDSLFSVELLREVIQAGLQILPLLHSNKMVHGDISPNNLLVCREGPGLPPCVVLNDFSETSQIGMEVSKYFGTRHYSSIRMDQVSTQNRSIQLNPIDDWQSFAIVLLEFCIPRPSLRLAQRLPWDAPLPISPMFSHKSAVLTSEMTIRDLLGGVLLDVVSQSLLQQFFIALFQHDYSDLASPVSSAICCLQSLLSHLTDIAVSSNVLIVRDDMKHIYHADTRCIRRLRQGLAFETVSRAQAVAWKFTPCPDCVDIVFVEMPDAVDLYVDELSRQGDAEVEEELL